MNGSPLPDDTSSWPRDPFELLGVTPENDDRDIKRAYQRLLRVYLPERHPEEFRRIREAYEAARDFRQWLAQAEPRSPPESDAGERSKRAEESSSATPADARAAENFRPDVDGALRRSPRFSVRERLAKGDFVAAYAEASDLARSSAAAVEPYLAAYWLLRFDPNLDRDRKPVQHLVDGLRNCADRRPLLEAYLGELERRPREAVRFETLDFALSLNESEAVEILRLRWEAASQAETWTVLERDLTRIAGSPLWRDRNAWLRIMSMLLHRSLWSLNPTADRVIDLCRRHIAQYDDVHASQFEALAHLDFLCDFAPTARALCVRIGNSVVFRLISRPPDDDPSENYLDLLALLEGCNFNASTLLKELSSFGEYSEVVLSRLGEALDRTAAALERYEDADWDVESLRDPVETFWMADDVRTYDDARAKLLEFCLKRHASPHLVAAVVQASQRIEPAVLEHLVDRIRSDSPLRCAYSAFRIFES